MCRVRRFEAGSAQPPNYEPWTGCAPVVWAAVEEFTACPQLAVGLHIIETAACPIEILIQDHGASSSRGELLPVFFSGAVTGRINKTPPFFSGVSMARQLGGAAVSVSDPSLGLSAELGLAWYAGNQWQDLQGDLAAVLDHISATRGVELLLIGGSGGGFAALELGLRLQRASVLVWNPQTDFLKYARPFVEAYLSSAFPDLAVADDWQARDLAEAFNAMGVRNSVTLPGVGCAGLRRLLYLQNASDWHVKAHAGPFLLGHGFGAVQRDLYTAHAGDWAMFFGSWGEGHAVPPIDLIREAVCCMRDPDFVPGNIFNVISDDVLGQVRKPEAAPFIVCSGQALDLQVSVAPAPGGLVASVVIQGEVRPIGAQYAFYAYSAEDRVQIHWYTDVAQAYLRSPMDRPVDKITAFVRDSLEQMAGSRECVVQARQEGLSRFFIYGSCVSRDAFAFGAPVCDYLARSSLASAFGTAGDPEQMGIDLASIESSFQRRMVESDVYKRAAASLAKSDFDLLLLDLIDERFSIVELDGKWVTVSAEFLKSAPDLNGRRLVRPEDPQRWIMWREGVKRMVDIVGQDRIVLNRVYWAKCDERGRDLPRQEDIHQANLLLSRMYGFLDSFDGLQAIEYPAELLVADSRHKWGVSPFHYVPDFYFHTLKSLASF